VAVVLRAQRIELVDRIRDLEGNIRVKLGASQSGSGLVLLNDRTEPGVQVLAGADSRDDHAGGEGKRGASHRSVNGRDFAPASRA
jgi:hypothetical protein